MSAETGCTGSGRDLSCELAQIPSRGVFEIEPNSRNQGGGSGFLLFGDFS